METPFLIISNTCLSYIPDSSMICTASSVDALLWYGRSVVSASYLSIVISLYALFMISWSPSIGIKLKIGHIIPAMPCRRPRWVIPPVRLWVILTKPWERQRRLQPAIRTIMQSGVMPPDSCKVDLKTITQNCIMEQKLPGQQQRAGAYLPILCRLLQVPVMLILQMIFSITS